MYIWFGGRRQAGKSTVLHVFPSPAEQAQQADWAHRACQNSRGADSNSEAETATIQLTSHAGVHAVWAHPDL